jgi:hypothetical protein
MHLFDHIANPGARENLGPASNPLDHCWCFSTPLRCFNLAINIRTGVAAPAFHFEPLVGAKKGLHSPHKPLIRIRRNTGRIV